MKLDIFYALTTLDNLQSMLDIQKLKSEELEVDYSAMFRIANTEFPNLYYLFSSLSGENIIWHWFSFSRDNRKFGLIRLSPFDNYIEEFCDDTTYESFDVVSHNCVIGKQGSFNLSLLTDDVIIDGISTITKMGIRNCITIIRIKFVDETIGMACINHVVPSAHVVFPSNEEEFTEWFRQIIRELGTKGDLDGIPISTILNVYYDCISFCFMEQDYKGVLNQ